MAVIRLYSHYWGRHAELYEKVTKPSILPSVERLRKEGHTVEFAVYESGTSLIETIRLESQKSVVLDAYTAIIPPDTIFGEETLYNIFKMAEGKNVMVAVPHLRVNNSAENIPVPITNKELPKQIKKHMHDTAVWSYDNLERNVTHGGISIREVDNHMCIVHSLPTIYMCKFNQADSKILYENVNTWNAWDGLFLAKMHQQQRVRVAGSSSFACVAEITEDGTRLKEAVGVKNNDTFRNARDYHKTFNQFSYVMDY